MTTQADRERHVAQMQANFQLEGFEPNEADKQLLAAYIDGTATLDDMLMHARLFAANAGVQMCSETETGRRVRLP